MLRDCDALRLIFGRSGEVVAEPAVSILLKNISF